MFKVISMCQNLGDRRSLSRFWLERHQISKTIEGEQNLQHRPPERRQMRRGAQGQLGQSSGGQPFWRDQYQDKGEGRKGGALNHKGEECVRRREKSAGEALRKLKLCYNAHSSVAAAIWSILVELR